MATEAHLLTKSVLEHRKSIASKTKSWPSVSGHDFERRKTFAVEMNALARSSDIQRSFLSVSCEHYGSIPTLAAQTCDPAEAVTGLKRGAAEQVRDDFSCEA